MRGKKTNPKLILRDPAKLSLDPDLLKWTLLMVISPIHCVQTVPPPPSSRLEGSYNHCMPDNIHSGEVGLAPLPGLRAVAVGPAHGPTLTGVSTRSAAWRSWLLPVVAQDIANSC